MLATKEERKRYRYDTLYMDIAVRVSQMSHAERAQVGALIVNEDRIISMGWNGMPSGWDNDCEETKQYLTITKPQVLHAESNAIAKLAKSNESGLGATMYCTVSPCMNCAKLIYQAGIKKVIYKDKYRHDDGIQFLRECTIHVQQLIDHRKVPNDDPPSVYNGGKTMREQYDEAAMMCPDFNNF